MWITNLAILFGQELNAEIERDRELAAGQPAVEGFALPPRGEPHDPEADAEQVSREGRFRRGDGNGGATSDEAATSLEDAAGQGAQAGGRDRRER